MNKNIQILLNNRELDTPQKVKAFDETLGEMSDDLDPESLSDMFRVLSDKTEQHEVMFGVIHYIEEYEPENIVNALLDSIEYLRANANEWLKIIFYRILNSPPFVKLLGNRVAKLDNKKAS